MEEQSPLRGDLTGAGHVSCNASATTTTQGRLSHSGAIVDTDSDLESVQLSKEEEEILHRSPKPGTSSPRRDGLKRSSLGMKAKAQLPNMASTGGFANKVKDKLTWKPNVIEREKKATIALYASKKMLSTTWDLSPALMHWAYISVVRRTLMYGVLVWWQAMEKKTYHKLMERTQRQALHPRANDRRKGCTTPSCIREYVSTRNGHSSICRDMSTISDYMVPRTCPDVRTTTFMGPDDWKTGQDHAQHFNIYTDGSKMEGGVGAGIYCTDPEMRLSYKLPSQCSIFQAEVFAIGQAAIRSMQSSAVSSKSVLASREALDISTTTSVRIYWVPSHQGIDGIETADGLAKEGVGLANERSENVPVSLRTLQSELERRADTRAKSRWRRASTTCKISKIMCKLSHYVLHLIRKDCRLLVGILTGHCLAEAHAVKLGITDNAKCQKCDEFEAIETVEHLKCKFSALPIDPKRFRKPRNHSLGP
ncbi:uncharacterized protein LOC122756531 [Drosophila santomea]|uniref:uncharacterized protein LOC122756531 n=1 Tax=Drosophila santomea TaxID=129105 RepID=UPI001CC907F5|nr:uncharacterized protein LOC122756531 [Drosophila santomea]